MSSRQGEIDFVERLRKQCQAGLGNPGTERPGRANAGMVPNFIKAAWTCPVGWLWDDSELADYTCPGTPLTGGEVKDKSSASQG